MIEIASLPARLSVGQASEIDNIELDDQLLSNLSGLVGDDGTDVLQFIIKAILCELEERKLEVENVEYVRATQKNILCIIPFHGSTLIDIRLIRPLRKWSELFHGEIKVVTIEKLMQTYNGLLEYMEWADIAVCLRENNWCSSYVLNLIQDSGIPLIHDLDDLLTELPDFLSSYLSSIANKKYLENRLRKADTVTTTTDRLAEKIRSYNQNVRVIPNCVRYSRMPNQKRYHNSGSVKLIIASSDTVKVGFIIDAINRVLNKTERTIEVVTIGPPGKTLNSHIASQVKQMPTMPYDEFRKYLEGLDNAIGLIPLDDSVFSSCKSPIKYFDYSISGIPVICSNLPPYSDVVVNLKTGILVNNTTEEWFDSILNLVEDAQKRLDITTKAWSFVNNNYLYEDSAICWNRLIDDVPKKVNQNIISKGMLHLKYIRYGLISVPNWFLYNSKMLYSLIKTKGIHEAAIRVMRQLRRK